LDVQVLPPEVKDAQQKKLEELKQQSDVHSRSELERKMALRYRKVKFFGINTYNMDLPQSVMYPGCKLWLQILNGTCHQGLHFFC
jgi:hypothetical protein